MGLARDSLFADEDVYSFEDGFGQTPMIQLIKAMGYKGDDKGMCGGLMKFLNQAVLCGEEENYLKRTAFMVKFYEAQKEIIDKTLRDRGIQIYSLDTIYLGEDQEKIKQYKSSFEDELKQLMQAKLAELHEKVKTRDPHNLSIEDHQWLEIDAFANGVEFLQNILKEYKEIDNLSYDAHEQFYALMASEELERRGGAKELFTHVWAFEHDNSNQKDKDKELREYMGNFAEILEKMPDFENIPINLHARGHVISIKLLGRNKKGEFEWLITDPSNMPPSVVGHRYLGDELYRYFPENSKQPDTIMQLTMLTTGEKYNTPDTINLRNNLAEFANSYQVDDKIRDLDKRNANVFAHTTGRVGLIGNLEKLDPKYKEYTLYILLKAIEHKDSRKFERMVDYVDLNQRLTSDGKAQKVGKTIAHRAAIRGSLEILKIIDEKGGDLFKKEYGIFGKSPLDYAKENKNHQPIVNFLESVKKRNELFTKLNSLSKRLHGSELAMVEQMKVEIKENWEKNNTNKNFDHKKWSREIETLTKTIIQARKDNVGDKKTTQNEFEKNQASSSKARLRA